VTRFAKRGLPHTSNYRDLKGPEIFSIYDNAVLNILNCTNIDLCHIETQEEKNHVIYGVNIFGESYINYLKSGILHIQYIDIQVEEKNHTLIISCNTIISISHSAVLLLLSICFKSTTKYK